MTPVALAALLAAVLAALGCRSAAAAERTVHDDRALRDALPRLRAGDVLLLGPGEYRGGLHVVGLRGTEAAPIVIRALDPERPPVIRGGGSGLQLSDCSGVRLAHLVLRGATGNGLNVDDGGRSETPSRWIEVEDLAVLDVGPRGNCDGIKLSGVEDFAVRRTRVEGWGGSAIDMVGCRRGVVEDCRFAGRDGFDQASGVQLKGGTQDVLVQTSLFLHAGERAVNLGGSTGLAFFRRPARFEAERVTVAGNRFVGATAPVAFVSSDDCRVVRNTIVRPSKWVLRILQEQRADGFLPCGRGRFEENLVVLDGRVRTLANVGPGTEPATFTLHRNAWFVAEHGAIPPLEAPLRQTGSVEGVDPRLASEGTAEMRVTSRDARLRGIGADAYVRPR